MTREHVQQIQKVTQRDKTLLLLIQQISEGWPEHCRKLPIILRPFWQQRDDFAIEHSCITWKGRLFIPAVLRLRCLQAILIVIKVSLRCKQKFTLASNNPPYTIKNYWPYSVMCSLQTTSNSQWKISAIPMAVPCWLWKTLGMDLFLHNNKWYVFFAEYYSKFAWV